MFDKYQFEHRGLIKSINGKTELEYKISTNKGQSGAPILRKIENDYYEVIGIHTTGATFCNKGVKFDDRIRMWISRMLGQLTGELNLS